MGSKPNWGRGIGAGLSAFGSYMMQQANIQNQYAEVERREGVRAAAASRREFNRMQAEIRRRREQQNRDRKREARAIAAEGRAEDRRNPVRMAYPLPGADPIRQDDLEFVWAADRARRAQEKHDAPKPSPSTPLPRSGDISRTIDSGIGTIKTSLTQDGKIWAAFPGDAMPPDASVEFVQAARAAAADSMTSGRHPANSETNDTAIRDVLASDPHLAGAYDFDELDDFGWDRVEDGLPVDTKLGWLKDTRPDEDAASRKLAELYNASDNKRVAATKIVNGLEDIGFSRERAFQLMDLAKNIDKDPGVMSLDEKERMAIKEYLDTNDGREPEGVRRRGENVELLINGEWHVWSEK